ncbi:ABC transporter substrate-binding protein [Agrococcus carbonis]|uniref:Carbohydrate ABC transporter substrate-binding protein, CUT1 family n=1 Tax=Agrococcus carbonis TaxID=684552 RepID=A0A1H1P5N7_9MICO|nr:ABC transporter substrate-binding protein [Agrococcus carbonis]SDS06512.1 carbohydrate ABC transporter substrate-binding protein, CUT1 family [Agrococcus carbonis]
MKHARRIAVPLGIAGVVALALTGCVGDAEPGASEEPGGSAAPGAAGCEAYADYGTFDGAEVNVYGTILNEEQERLNESWAEFEECTGIDVVYEGSAEFEAQINVRIQGGNPPDLAIFPQPGLLQSVVGTGSVLEAPEAVQANAQEYWNETWQGFGTVDGTVYAAPLMASVKGFVWYSPSVWEENGWEVPTTLDEVDEVTAAIAESGVMKPWCVGFGSGEATGWPGTDWLEDYVIRTAGADVYDQWVAHEIPFDSPEIVAALDRVGALIKDDANVNGGIGDVTTIATTDFGEAGLPVLDGECAMHHQASFYEGFWGDGVTVAEDGDVWAFILPGQEAGAADVTGGGELVGAFSDAEEVVATQTYLSSPEWANSRVSLGGVLSANSGLDPANASSDLLRQAYDILQDPNTTFRFDGSDLMPGAVGSGTLWRGMVDWISGTDSETMLATVEDSWPQ